MQLKKPMLIRDTLATATCTLLGGISATQASESNPWEVDTAFLYYAETDRVSVFEPVFNVRKELDDDEYINLRLVLDALTGASANGAIPTDTTQTFTSPSGENTYTTNANETPLDTTFSDTRGALDGSWEIPLMGLTKTVWGASFSREFDYLSYGVSASLSQDFNNRNTTMNASFAYGRDNSKPIGGAPVGLSSMPTSTATEKQKLAGDQFKTINDLLLGVTQVINRHSLLQVNYGYGRSSGYMNDPYKIISVVDNTTADTIDYLWEKRPDTRTKQTLYVQYVHQFTEDVIRSSYRYFWDDWDITSHTVDLRYRYELGAEHFLQPHLRYYQQSAASFYHYFLRDGNIPEYASADYRLGDLTSTTFGILYGVDISALSQFSIRVEKLTQSGDGQPDEAFGKIRNQNLYPDINTWIVQLGYSFSF